jgi:short-subunit dehydrogenase
MEENKATNIRFQLVCASAVNTPLINQAVEKGPKSLREMQKTGKNIDTPEFIINTLEKALEKGKKVNYPGIANPIQVGYRLFPSLVKRITAKMS